ncbi:hypothetical protein [Clostridium sp.]|uniref:hypothetical protein n=1 Tax=Clostridium sp. TaxID=1506 RepID=UPI003F673E34
MRTFEELHFVKDKPSTYCVEFDKIDCIEIDYSDIEDLSHNAIRVLMSMIILHEKKSVPLTNITEIECNGWYNENSSELVKSGIEEIIGKEFEITDVINIYDIL